MRHLRSRSITATALLLGALSCSDDSSDNDTSRGALTPGNGGSAGQSSNAGSSSGGNGGSAGGAAAGSGGNADASANAGSSSGGAPGAAGTANVAGAGGAPPADAGADSGFPTPDKLVALSFDDGPEPTATGLVLDKLEAHGVPASFFLIGGQIALPGDQAVLDRAEALGCEFENHSNGFTPRIPVSGVKPLSAQAVTDSINATNAAILNATGQTAVFFRPPSLATDANMFANINMPFAAGLLGNDFPGGGCGAIPSVECVSNNILNGVQDGTIILLHDVQPDLNPHPTVAALDIILPELKQRGFEIVTLRTLFTRRGVNPNSMAGMVWQSVPPTN